MRYGFLMLSVFFVLQGCRFRQEIPAELKRIPLNHGMLYVDPDAEALITGGIVHYRIYATGDVYYSGDVSYFGSGPLKELQVPFEGKSKIDPKYVLSKSFVKDAVIDIDKVRFEVDKVDDTAKTVALTAYVNEFHKVDSTDAEGQILLDVSKPIIAIKSADIEGTVFENKPSEVKIRIKLISK